MCVFLLTFSVLSMVGLFLIALGTGGIKPCVAAFGGDQFSEHQVRLLSLLLFDHKIKQIIATSVI